ASATRQPLARQEPHYESSLTLAGLVRLTAATAVGRLMFGLDWFLTTTPDWLAVAVCFLIRPIETRPIRLARKELAAKARQLPGRLKKLASLLTTPSELASGACDRARSDQEPRHRQVSPG